MSSFILLQTVYIRITKNTTKNVLLIIISTPELRSSSGLTPGFWIKMTAATDWASWKTVRFLHNFDQFETLEHCCLWHALCVCYVQYIVSVEQCQYAALLQTKAARLSLKSVTTTRDANIAGVILVTFLIVLIFALLAWFVYAYRNPNSQSGIWLIQVCPCYDVTVLSNVSVLSFLKEIS